MMSHTPPSNDDPQRCTPGLDENGLPLPDPFPDYLVCPHCGEEEVEVWCYQTEARCHVCGEMLPHRPPVCWGTSDKCMGYKGNG